MAPDPPACPDFQALPGPSGYCFYYLRLRPGLTAAEITYCGHPGRPMPDCGTGGYRYRPFFPPGGPPVPAVNPGLSGRKNKGKRRRSKG